MIVLYLILGLGIPVALLSWLIIALERRNSQRWRRLGEELGLQNLIHGVAAGCAAELEKLPDGLALFKQLAWRSGLPDGAIVRLAMPNAGQADAISGEIHGLRVLVLRLGTGVQLGYKVNLVEQGKNNTWTVCMVQKPGLDLPHAQLAPPRFESADDSEDLQRLSRGLRGRGRDLYVSTLSDTVCIRPKKRELSIGEVRQLLQTAIEIMQD